MDVWIVLIEDRHSDVEARPFSSEERAVEYARAEVPDDAEEVVITEGMRRDGWVLCLSYSAESDCVRVIKRTMDDVPRA